MTSKNKEKGSAWERTIVAALRAQGFNVERMYGAGRQDDRGDIRGLSGWTIEAKDHAKHDLSGWQEELRVEMENGRTDLGAVVIKRRGMNVSGAYVVLPWSVFVQVLKATNA